MKITLHEAATIAYALNMLALSDDKKIVLTASELRDLSSRVLINSIKEDK